MERLGEHLGVLWRGRVRVQRALSLCRPHREGLTNVVERTGRIATKRKNSQGSSGERHQQTRAWRYQLGYRPERLDPLGSRPKLQAQLSKPADRSAGQDQRDRGSRVLEAC